MFQCSVIQFLFFSFIISVPENPKRYICSVYSWKYEDPKLNNTNKKITPTGITSTLLLLLVTTTASNL